MKTKIMFAILGIAAVLTIGITTPMNIGQQVANAAPDHGDTVSGAAGIIGPDIKSGAQLQKDPGSVSDPAQIIGPSISAVGVPNGGKY